MRLCRHLPLLGIETETHMHAYTHMQMYTHIHVPHTHTHTYTHTHTHTHTHAVYSEGSIFTATKCIFKSHASNVNGSVRPEINQPIIEPAEETLPSDRSNGKDMSKRETPPHLSELTVAISTGQTSHPSKETPPVVHKEQVSSYVPALVEISEPTEAGAIIASEQGDSIPPSILPNLHYKSSTRPAKAQLPFGEPHRVRSFSDSNLDDRQKENTISRLASLPQLPIDGDCEVYHHKERFQSGKDERESMHQPERKEDGHSRIYLSVQEEVSQPHLLSQLTLYQSFLYTIGR